MSATLTFVAHGVPVPQGSKRVYNGHPVDSNAKQLHPWRDTVTAAALDALAAGYERDGNIWSGALAPLAVDIVFTFTRPASHYGTGRNASVLRPSAPACPAGRPDLDKLVRAVLDACTVAGCWRDDAQVVELTAVKGYARTPGARIVIVPTTTIREETHERARETVQQAAW